MSNEKISALTTLTVGSVDTTADWVPIVDSSASQTKKVAPQSLVTDSLKAPGPIGGTTPGTGAFTSITCTSATSSSGGVGYSTGAGGMVSQTTSTTTAVTINKICGRIITYNDVSVVTAFTDVSFRVNNNTVGAGDVVVLSLGNIGSSKVLYTVENVSPGAFYIRINYMSNSATPVAVINFAVIKATHS